MIILLSGRPVTLESKFLCDQYSVKYRSGFWRAYFIDSTMLLISGVVQLTGLCTIIIIIIIIIIKKRSAVQG